jgi:hypothetical protein
LSRNRLPGARKNPPEAFNSPGTRSNPQAGGGVAEALAAVVAVAEAAALLPGPRRVTRRAA